MSNSILYFAAAIGYFSIELLLLGFICFVVYIILDTENKKKSYEEAYKEDRKYWKERVKRSFDGIRA